MVTWAGHLMAAAPVLTNTAFALTQLGLAVGLLWGRRIRLVLAVSIIWSIGVWCFGEGLGGMASGSSTLLTGAPGAVLLYAVIAALAWPSGESGAPHSEPPVWGTRIAWSLLWVGGAVLSSLPKNAAHALADQITGNASGVPAWLASIDHPVARAVSGSGAWTVAVIVAAQLVVSLGVLARREIAQTAVAFGVMGALAFWLVGQSLGLLWTGHSTDPNAAPLIILLAVAVFGTFDRSRRREAMATVTAVEANAVNPGPASAVA